MVQNAFADVRYCISLTLQPEKREALGNVLNTAGATAVPLDDLGLTHFITPTPPTDGSLELLPPNSKAQLVTPAWVDRSFVAGTPQAAEFYSPDPALLFSGVVATATDLSSRDVELMSAAITALGGQWRTTLTKDVTHVFALAPGSQKYETAMYYRDKTRMLVLVPHWFEDSVRLGIKGLPTEEYEWPEPSVFKSPFNPDKGDVGPADLPKTYRIPSEKAAYFDTALASGKDVPFIRAPSRDIWKGLKVLLSATLDLSESQRDAHEADIRREGGIVVGLEKIKSGSAREIAEEEAEKVSEADVLVTRFRAGAAYVKAFKLNKTIGSLTWLWFVRASGTLSRPTDHLLHYPIPKKPIENFSSHVITITNYTGKHRDYLKKLIATMGAEFTPSMSPRNTVVIAAYISGVKTNKAVSWSIPVVNHTWLEDCFVQWRALTPAQGKYIIFPPRVDFSQLLADKGLGGRVGFTQEELEALEADQDASDDPDTQETARNGQHAMAPIATSTSARDAREVEDAVMAEDEVGDLSVGEDLERELHIGDDEMDVDEDGSAGKHSRTLPKAGPSRVNDSDSDSVRGQATSSRRRPPKRSKLIRPSSPGEQSINPGLEPRQGLEDDVYLEAAKRTPQKRKSTSSRGQQDEVQEQPGSDKKKGRANTRKGRSLPQLPSEDDSDDPMELDFGNDERQRPKVRQSDSSKSRKNNSNKRRGTSDTEEVEQHLDSDDHEDVQPRRSYRRKANISPSDASAPAEPSGSSHTPISPAKGSGTPKRQVSVLLPTVAAVYSSPSRPGSSPRRKLTARTDSLHVEAAEAPLQSPHKRDRLIHDDAVALSTPSKSGKRDAAATATPQPGPSHVQPASVTRTPSRRSAATKATRKLHEEIMPDVMNFQKEMKNGHVRAIGEGDKSSAKEKGGPPGTEENSSRQPEKSRSKKRVSLALEDALDSDEEEPDKKRQRRISTGQKKGKATAKSTGGRLPSNFKDGDEPSEEEDEGVGAGRGSRRKPVGKGKTSTDPQPARNTRNVRIMTTQVNISDDVTRALVKMGAKMTTKPSDCTHLVAKSLVRTEKFLCAMAVAPYIVNEKWVIASATTKQFLPEENYALQDPENEKKYGFKLSDALQRARDNGRKLFAGKMFYVTPKVPIDTKLLKNIITAGGGQVSTQTPTVRILNGNENRFVISSPTDKSIWRPLAEQGYTIYNQELILTGALKQEIDWENPTNKVTDT